MNSKKDILKKYKVEIIAFLIYVVGISVVTAFHEPWFDEAQAWQIAGTASLHDILFEIPHYEGHPQLWYFVLMPFARLGAPYLFSIKLVNTLFCSAAMFLLIFKSPLPRLIRCALPFNFFFFYHYGVISRPYGMMMLAMFLMAATYKSRNEKPIRFVLSLAFLCSTHMYGMVIAGTVALVWVSQIFLSHKDKKIEVFKDKRCYILLCLLALAVLIIIDIMPREDTYNIRLSSSFKSRAKCFIQIPMYVFEALWGMQYSYEGSELTEFTWAIESLCGTAIFLLIFMYAKKVKCLGEFVVPTVGYLIFYSQCYGAMYHLGILLAYFVCFFWMAIDCSGDEYLREVYEKVKSIMNTKLLKRLGSAAAAAAILLPIAQSAVSSVRDIIHPYALSAELKDFIKENNLEDLKFLGEWVYSYDLSDVSTDSESDDPLDSMTREEKLAVRSDCVALCGIETELMPYFDTNFFVNFGNEDGTDMYSWYRKTENIEEYFEEWAEKGLPDVIISECELDLIYDEEDLDKVEYVRVFCCTKYAQFKFVETEYTVSVYMREDLLEEYGLEELPF